MTIRILRPAQAMALSCVLALSGCQNLQGSREGDLYNSPAGAYSIDLGINTFRGRVTLDERCDRYGGSTTLWDSSGRMFRVDYVQLEGNPNIRAPRFASDQTLLSLVLNAYLRGIITEAPMVKTAEVAHREFLQQSDPQSLFTIVSLDIDASKDPSAPPVTGTYYYGLLLFKQGDRAYIVQHRQPALMQDTMKSVLLRIADGMEIPGVARDDTEMERTRRMLARLAPGEHKNDPVRLCAPPTVGTR
jgi:hypothetical protein